MPKKKKEAIDLFPSSARLRNMEPPDDLVPEDLRNGEFRDTAVLFAPSQQRGECGMTIRFRCTTKIARGDTVTIRLGGFKGPKSGVFALESRPHPEDKAYNHNFQAYYSGDDSPKGVPSQAVILRCRSAVEENALVILGVPEAAHVVLPDKLALNSTKIKIEGIVRHTEGGKIPKAPVMECSEVRKRPVDDDIAELEAIISEYVGTEQEPGTLRDGDMEVAEEITPNEADVILENVAHRRQLPMGMSWRGDSGVFSNFEEGCLPLVKALGEAYDEQRRTPMAVHRELARNLGVKLAVIIVLEDALYTMHGAYYPELTRSAVMVLRLYTMEAHDLAHLFDILQAPCIHREIHSAVRTRNTTLVKKWVNVIAVLSTCPSKLTLVASEKIPTLYCGFRDIPSDHLQRLTKLKKGDWYVTSHFLTCSMDINATAEDFSAPDNAVLFEIRKAVEGVEIGDCSQYPLDQHWILPMMSSFSIQSVETLQERNGLIKVVMDMRSSLGSSLRDERFPQETRSDPSSSFFKRARAAVDLPIARRTAALAKCIYASLRLQERRTLQPQQLMHAKYLVQYAETQRASIARKVLDEGLLKWLICSAEQTVTPDGVVQPARWESLNRKYAIPLEAIYRKRTRAVKQFTSESPAFTVDFGIAKVDIGKGPQGIRRVVGRADIYPFNPL